MLVGTYCLDFDTREKVLESGVKEGFTEVTWKQVMAEQSKCSGRLLGSMQQRCGGKEATALDLQPKLSSIFTALVPVGNKRGPR